MFLTNRTTAGLLLASVLPILVFGCSGDDDDAPDSRVIATVETQGGGTPVVELFGPATVEGGAAVVSTDEPPATTASSGGGEVEMGIGTYCWGNLCVDKIGPITLGSLVIASGSEVRIGVPDETPALREVSIMAFPAANSQQLEDGSTAWQPDFENSVALLSERDEDEVRIDAALEPGTYVLTVGMFFEDGDVQYGVVLKVQ